jgi:hypothetical protein
MKITLRRKTAAPARDATPRVGKRRFLGALLGAVGAVGLAQAGPRRAEAAYTSYGGSQPDSINTNLHVQGSVWLTNGGPLGVGTTVPTARLHADGGLLRVSNLTVNMSRVDIRGGTDGGNSSSIYLHNPAGALGAVISDGTYSSYLQASGGNLGVGTVSPEKKLHVVREAGSRSARS